MSIKAVHTTSIWGIALILLLLVGATDVLADEIRRVSMGITGSTKAQGFSDKISDDGSTIVFTSRAPSLVLDDRNSRNDIFVYDRASKEISRVSVSSSGEEANDYSQWASTSADGRMVAFMSQATNLVENDQNGFRDVFVHDRVTGITTRVSVSSQGEESNEWSAEPRMSSDGRVVIFWSLASNLVADDTNGNWDIFLHILDTGETIRIEADSPDPTGEQLPDLSADNRYVVFHSRSSVLVSGDTNNARDVFVRDLQTGTTELISKGFDGSPANGNSHRAAISSDGRYVSFISFASNIVQPSYPSQGQVFVYDRQENSAKIVSLSDNGTPIGRVDRQSISKDGRFVVFNSHLDDYVVSDNNGLTDVFRHEIASGVTQIVSVGIDGAQSDGYSEFPAISGDGSVVVFNSTAANLVPGAYNYAPENPDFGFPTIGVFSVDLASGVAEIVSSPIQPNEPPNGANAASISRDGGLIAFDSTTDNYLIDEEDGFPDLYLFDVSTQIYSQIGQPDLLGFVRQYAGPKLSADGTALIYEMNTTNESTFERQSDVYLYSFATDQHTLVSATPTGFPADGDCMAYGYDITASGHMVAFTCDATDIAVGDTNGDYDVFIRDMGGRVTEIVSKSSDGTSGNGMSRSPSITDDGSKVVFVSEATNLVDSDTNLHQDVFLHDNTTSETTRLSENSGTGGNDRSTSGKISPDGRYAAFLSRATNLTGDVKGSHYDVFLRNLSDNSLTIVSRGLGQLPSDDNSWFVEFTPDSQFLLFASAATNIVSDDTNGFVDLFKYELNNGTVERVSETVQGEAANGDTWWGDASDGVSSIAFASTATNFGPLDTNGQQDIYLRIVQPVDTDGDGVPDDQDAFPNDPTEWDDSDGDGVGDNTDNCPNVTNVGQLDFDNDALGDACDTDDDNDGVLDVDDAFPLDPTEASDFDGDGQGDNADTDDDNDEMPDTWEEENGLDPRNSSDAGQDPDGDGDTNLEEFQAGTDPNDPNSPAPPPSLPPPPSNDSGGGGGSSDPALLGLLLFFSAARMLRRGAQKTGK